MWLIGIRSQSLLLHQLVAFKVPLMEEDLTITFKGEDMGCHPIQKPAIVADHDRATAEAGNTIFQRSQRFNVEIVCWFVQQQQIAARYFTCCC